MGISNFQTFTEVDPNSHIETTSSRVAFAGLESRDEVAYVYKDMGVDHFDGDFTHYFNITLTSGTDGTAVYYGSLQNSVGDVKSVLDSGNEAFVGARIYNSAGTYRLSLIEINNGSMYGWDDYYVASVGTIYYCKMERDDDFGTFGKLYLYIYQNSDYTTLLDTPEITLHVKADFRYAYGINTYDDNSSGIAAEGYIDFLNIGEIVPADVNRVNVSNGDDLIEHCDSLTGWTDGDAGSGVSTQIMLGGKQCFKFDSGSSIGSGNYARLYKTLAPDEHEVISFQSYHDDVGTLSDVDYFQLIWRKASGYGIIAEFCSNGIYIRNSVDKVEVGTNLVKIGEWQNWTIDFDISVPASATCDVYLDGVKVGTGVFCNYQGPLSDHLQFLQAGYGTANQITYLNYFIGGSTLIPNVLSNASFKDEDCANIALASSNVYEDNCGGILQQSNGSVFIENCVSLTDWTDVSAGDGVVSAVDYLTQKTFKLDSGSIGSGNDANISQDVGTFGTRVVATIKLNSPLLGSKADNDHLNFQVRRAGVLLSVAFASNGLFISDGAAWHEVGTNLVAQNVDQTWTFDCDFATPASATCDVYLNGILKASGIDCSYTGTFTEGQVVIRQYGYTLANCISYVDKVEIGDDLVTDSIDTWEDNDSGTNAESSQVVFQGDACFKFDSGDQSGSNYAARLKDIGSLGNSVVLSVSLYCSAIGLLADSDIVYVTVRRNDVVLKIGWATDGLFIYDGASWNEVGTNLVQIGAWQEWTFDCDFTTPASATCDIYLDGVLQASSADCSDTGSFNNGDVYLSVYGYNTANRIAYVRDIKIGDAFLWEDNDNGTGAESTQATFDSKDCFKFDSGSAASQNRGRRDTVVGAFGSRVITSFSLYCYVLGDRANNNDWYILLDRNDVRCLVAGGSDGLFVYSTAGGYVEVGANIVQESAWQEYTLDIDFDSATVDVYLDGVRHGSDLNFYYAGVAVSGTVVYAQQGYTTANRISYTDWIKVGDGFEEEEIGISFVFSNPIPIHQAISYGLTTILQLTTTVSGEDAPYVYDATFYNGYNNVQIGSTVSGIESGNYASTTFSTTSGGEYRWYVTATSSGEEDTSSVYNFTNKFLCAGDVKVDDVLTSGIYVRLYRRSTGTLVGEEISTVGGIFQIETDYNEEHYCVALGPDEYTNALIYDRVSIT